MMGGGMGRQVEGGQGPDGRWVGVAERGKERRGGETRREEVSGGGKDGRREGVGGKEGARVADWRVMRSWGR